LICTACAPSAGAALPELRRRRTEDQPSSIDTGARISLRSPKAPRDPAARRADNRPVRTPRSSSPAAGPRRARTRAGCW
jgi:hypothetical protein